MFHVFLDGETRERATTRRVTTCPTSTAAFVGLLSARVRSGAMGSSPRSCCACTSATRRCFAGLIERVPRTVASTGPTTTAAGPTTNGWRAAARWCEDLLPLLEEELARSPRRLQRRAVRAMRERYAAYIERERRRLPRLTPIEDGGTAATLDRARARGIGLAEADARALRACSRSLSRDPRAPTTVTDPDRVAARSPRRLAGRARAARARVASGRSPTSGPARASPDCRWRSRCRGAQVDAGREQRAQVRRSSSARRRGLRRSRTPAWSTRGPRTGAPGSGAATWSPRGRWHRWPWSPNTRRRCCGSAGSSSCGGAARPGGSRRRSARRGGAGARAVVATRPVERRFRRP